MTVSDRDPAAELLTEPADDGRAGLMWRRNVIIAAVVLACLGAMVGTAFGLANMPEGDDAAGPAPTPTASLGVSAEPSATVSETSPAPEETGGCTSNCGGNQTNYKTVPHVIDKDETSARTAVTNAGLSPKVVYVCNGHSVGKVVAQDPGGGVTLPAGRTVEISVGGVKVPDVAGDYVDYAKQQIADAGLKASVSSKPGGGEPGTVLSQSPSAGSCVKGGSTVTVTVPGATQAPPSAAAAGGSGG